MMVCQMDGDNAWMSPEEMGMVRFSGDYQREMRSTTDLTSPTALYPEQQQRTMYLFKVSGHRWMIVRIWGARNMDRSMLVQEKERGKDCDRFN